MFVVDIASSLIVIVKMGHVQYTGIIFVMDHLIQLTEMLVTSQYMQAMVITLSVEFTITWLMILRTPLYMLSMVSVYMWYIRTYK